MYLLLILAIAQSALAKIDLATDQMLVFRKEHPEPIGNITTKNGALIPYDEAQSTLNKKLILNRYFMETITSIVRERIPERVVHAKGAGAFGYFEVTDDISEVCKAEFLSDVGKKTPVAVRFSPSVGEKGFTDLNRGTRGFAIKLYSKEGNLDLLGFNTEMYSYKDPRKIDSIIHTSRRNPATNLRDSRMPWDFITLNPEAAHMFMSTLGDRGIPASYRNMPSFPIHLYQVVGKNGTVSFMKFHFIPDDGIKNFTSKEAANISASDPDYLTRDLYRAIAECNYPSWTMLAQILNETDIEDMGPRAFDVTRTISKKKHPLKRVGKLVLNRNPKNHFAEIEQLAFCPCNLVPGILGAPDKLFEGRVMAYRDAQIYRLGPNNHNIPVNCPFQVGRTYNYYRDGEPPVGNNQGDAPNYYPNTFNGPTAAMVNEPELITIEEKDEPDNADQISNLYCSFPPDEKTRLVENIIDSLEGVNADLQERVIAMLTGFNDELGTRVNKALQEAIESSSS